MQHEIIPQARCAVNSDQDAVFREVLKPTVSLSVLVLGLSLAGQLNVMSPPPLPKMYVVPAEQSRGRNYESETRTTSHFCSHFI